MLRGWLTIMALLLGAGGALAQAPSPDDAFVRFVHGSAYRERIASVAQAQHKTIGNGCADTRYEIPDELVPVGPITMGADGTPASGAWIQYVGSAGCGKTLQFRILVVYVAGQAPRYSPLFPGGTKADLVLGFDAYKMIVPILDSRFGKCGDLPMVTDTRFEEFTGPPVPDALHAGQRPWRESWTLSSCKGRFKVPLQFQPDSTGTAFSVNAKGITKLK